MQKTLVSHVSRVRLCATPYTVAHQAPIPGILQASILEWVAISFSTARKWKVKVKSLSPVQLFVTLHPWDFPGKSTGVGCHGLLRQKSLLYFKTFSHRGPNRVMYHLTLICRLWERPRSRGNAQPRQNVSFSTLSVILGKAPKVKSRNSHASCINTCIILHISVTRNY